MCSPPGRILKFYWRHLTATRKHVVETDGMFAFAISMKKQGRSSPLDRFGEKPFFIRSIKKSFVLLQKRRPFGPVERNENQSTAFLLNYLVLGRTERLPTTP
jgi:asparagine synthetase B (glutamine-hydrolysing)